MGNFVSRQNAAVEEADYTTNHAYKYPPRAGNFFGTHFIMGGERFDTPQPESYLFGENADLNFLGNRPTAFPYPPPQANEPTKTLKSLVNIRKESVRFVRVPNNKKQNSTEGDCIDTLQQNDKKTEINESIQTVVDGNVLCNVADKEMGPPNSCYNIEFTFDSDAKCAITVYYFCTENVSPSGVTLTQREGLTFSSDTYHYEKGINQCFSQPSHVFNPQLIHEDDLVYNAGRDQYPVAIHCVIEEGNEECRQSHTTICVIDHHPETRTFVLRALKQKIFVDGLCYLLQEIYGIENKAVNKSSQDEEIDDHGSECVICMSESRDTLILPCRHLCLCNSCADSLRYQANNCPICRAPFRALLQIRAVQKGISTHMLHQNTPTSVAGESAPIDIPSGYIPVSLIEALNGPPQYVARARNIDQDNTENVTVAASTMTCDDIRTTSPVKSSSRRPKIKKNASTCTATNEVGTLTNKSNGASTASVLQVESDPNKSTITFNSSTSTPTLTCSPKKQEMHLINERHNGLKYQKHNVGVDDEDSENEKLSPLLSPGSKSKKQVVASLGIRNDDVMDSDRQNNDVVVSGGGEKEVSVHDAVSVSKKRDSIKRVKHRPDLDQRKTPVIEPGFLATNLSAEDSDYYTPEDTQNTILSPLCQAERAKSGDSFGSSRCGVESRNHNDTNMPNAIGVGYSSAVKKNLNLHNKSTSVGNIVGPGAATTTSSGVVDLKINNICWTAQLAGIRHLLEAPVIATHPAHRPNNCSALTHPQRQPTS
ncbi:E3 ubiquitin ligase RNF157 isoform X2 [Drosophila innubila]|uniref:E3 ubiquitin ligase RNF157 isoform X2 n=1 Tax=Drosophila innubila TaxID=198719 RepID=UPI00148C2536|nr:E3 ubiquitin ligase RNF157 isoform X2 [Drosophila innubila]